MNNNRLGLDPDSLPRNPYYPAVDPQGPSFLDTGGCLCALRTTPAGDTPEPAWQCIGDQAAGVYTVDTGRWFNTLNGSGEANSTINDASNGPNTKKPLIWVSGALSEPQGTDGLSVADGACTGENETTMSTAFYQASEQISNKKQPISAAPCWRASAVPVEIQTVESWKEEGCGAGFLCKNNTVNSLPQYCPPWDACQVSRLSSFTCSPGGKNIGMGPFEPVICQAGNYCPKSANGKESHVCPSGSYCQLGAVTPTPCLVGSRCPEGSSYELFIIPLAILIFSDLLMILGMIVYQNRMHLPKPRADKCQHKSHLRHCSMSGVRALITKYKALPKDSDHEMLPVSVTNTPCRTDSFGGGFLVALNLDSQSSLGSQPIGIQLNPQLLAFVSSMRRATNANNLGLSFNYSDLSFQPKKSSKMILQNVTGSINRGTLTAVMGGSGAGKSTFVNVLMGKTKNTSGIVVINNNLDNMKRYKKVIGYVPQDDIILPELTVYENIVHSAKIRLPQTWSNSNIECHVESVIECLELSHVRNSLIGTVGRPVISGGQRKRVSIGMELAAAPMAIFLDEPTSGLDATAAFSVMHTLKAVAHLGITVIVIIHQPRMEIFDLFNNLILLGKGQTIYEGPLVKTQSYFEGMGFSFPQHSNHGDVVTDIITGNGRDHKPTGEISQDFMITHWTEHRKVNIQKEHYTSSIISNNRMKAAIRHRGAPFYKQMWLCLCRAMLQQYRTKAAFWSEMGLAALAGFLLGLAQNSKKGILFTGTFKGTYSILSTAVDLKSAPELALLVAIAIGLVAGAPGVKTFSEELLVQRREAEAGHLRLAYFVAKVVSVFPRMLFGCLHFTTLFFVLTVPIINWGLAFLVNFFYFYCIYGLASIISMVVRREDAPLFATMISLIVAILSGAAPPLSEVKKWHIEWLWRASPGVWLAEIYFGQLVSPFEYLYDIEMAAEQSGFHLNWLWRNMVALVGIGSFYRVIAFLAMLLAHRRRR